jgi:ADP-heptose:LPS heptosyltransferase
MNKLLKIVPKQIAIFRALQLGDLLCAIPAVRALKHSFPEAEITLIGLPWVEKFTKRFSHYFTDFIIFPGYPGLPEQNYSHKAFIDFLKKTKRRKFDLAIQMHGNGSIVNPFTQMLGAKHTAGYCEPGRFCPDEKFYMHYPEGFHEVERHLKLMKFLGVPLQGNYLEFPISKEEETKFMKLCNVSGLKAKEYVCVHPGARDMNHWWPAEKFAMVADQIADKGYTILLTGSEAEKETVSKVETLMKHTAINCVGKTDLGTLAVLIKNAKMIISNDTGASQIAAAMQTPSVVIFLASDPVRWAPQNKDLHQIILPQYSEDVNYVFKKTKRILLYNEVEKKSEIKSTVVRLEKWEEKCAEKEIYKPEF